MSNKLDTGARLLGITSSSFCDSSNKPWRAVCRTKGLPVSPGLLIRECSTAFRSTGGRSSPGGNGAASSSGCEKSRLSRKKELCLGWAAGGSYEPYVCSRWETFPLSEGHPSPGAVGVKNSLTRGSGWLEGTEHDTRCRCCNDAGVERGREAPKARNSSCRSRDDRRGDEGGTIWSCVGRGVSEEDAVSATREHVSCVYAKHSVPS